jgi:hypothetical protein
MIVTPEEVSEGRKNAAPQQQMTNTFSFAFKTTTDRLPIREIT